MNFRLRSNWWPALLWVLLSVGCSDGGQRAETVFLGGTVITMDEAGRRVEALAVADGRILRAGSEDEIRALAGPETRVVDLEGGALLPGFVDAHSHIEFASWLIHAMVPLYPSPIGDTDDMGALLAKVAARVASAEPEDWVLGIGYDDTLLAEKRHPTRLDLDAVSGDHPVVLLHISGHLAVANSRALALAGLNDESPEPPGHAFRRLPDGSLSGVLEEATVMRAMAKVPLRPMEERLEDLRTLGRRYLAAGITLAQNGYTGLADLPLFKMLTEAEGMRPRLVIWPNPQLALALDAGEAQWDFADHERLHLGAVKIIGDGSIQGYTGYLSKPYHTPFQGDATYRGYPSMPAEQLRELVQRLHDAGWQLAIHGNGDAAIDDILAAIEAAFARTPRADARPIIIHAQMSREDQLDRMARLGVIPSFFVLHTYYWGDRHRDIFLGPERAARISPTRSATERGIPYTIHTDAPIVPMEPLRLIWAAVNRLTLKGASLGAGQRATVDEALRAVTLDAARQYFMEDQLGSLEPGKLADLVLLSADPAADPAGIDRLTVLGTWLEGEQVFAAPAAP